MGGLDRDVFFLTEPELPNWKEVKLTPANPALVWTKEEAEKGYVTFPADYTEQIPPTHRPARLMVGRPMTALATPGEFEPATFCVLTQRELGNAAVELSEFVGDKGQGRIARENVSLGIVRCWPQRVSGWGGNGEYQVVPEMIEPPVGRAGRVQAGQLRQWWLTVHVPPEAAAGRYRMSLTVRPEKAPLTVIECCLLVLPFQLSRPANKHWGTWLDSFPPVGSLWGPERRGRKVPAEIDRLAQADIADYRAHGFDLVLLNYYFGARENPDGTFTFGLSTLPEDLERLKGLGSDAPVVICFEYTCRNWEYQFTLPFASAPDNPPPTVKPGPNLVENPSFEDSTEADGSPTGRYHLGYPSASDEPVGALQVTDESAHTGHHSLRWDLSKVAQMESTRREPRWLTVNVTVPSDTVKRLRGQRVRIGYWMRLRAGATLPGLQLRQNLKNGPGDRFSYGGGVADPSVWNHFETEGRLSPELESMDIHTWCSLPEPELARGSCFYTDDVSLEVIEEPPLGISTPLDEYYVGEPIAWTANTAITNGTVVITLLAGERRIAEQTLPVATGFLLGAFESGRLKLAIYTLQAMISNVAPQAPLTAQRQVVVAPDPFDWQ